MDWYNIIMTVLAVIFGFLSIYVKTKTNIAQDVAGKIAEAEEMYKDTTGKGGEKFTWVVDTLYEWVPVVMQPFISKELIGVMVQKAFDAIEEYATKQLDKVVDEVKDKVDGEEEQG